MLLEDASEGSGSLQILEDLPAPPEPIKLSLDNEEELEDHDEELEEDPIKD